jgi:hypothetical protein
VQYRASSGSGQDIQGKSCLEARFSSSLGAIDLEENKGIRQ